MPVRKTLSSEHRAKLLVAAKSQPRKVDDEEVTELYQSGQSSLEIAKNLGCTKTTVLRALKRNGVERRGGRKYNVNHLYFDTIDTEEKAYWLGFTLADGCVFRDETRHNSSRRFAVKLARGDRGHLEKLKTALDAENPISDGQRASFGAVRYFSTLCINSTPLFNALVALGITERKSLTAAPWSPPSSLERHYWRGVWDGDGWIREAGDNGWEIGLCGSKRVVCAFSDFLASILGYTPTVTPDKNIFQTCIYALADIQTVITILYSDATVWLDRKHDLAQLCLQTKKLPRITGGLPKLTQAKASHLRFLHERGASRKELAALFGISVANVSATTTGRIWKEEV